jgi:hypothetical protein
MAREFIGEEGGGLVKTGVDNNDSRAEMNAALNDRAGLVPPRSSIDRGSAEARVGGQRRTSGAGG